MAKVETEHGARILLSKIKEYWASKGYEVDGQIYPAGYSERLRSTVYEVRTDLVNGMPRKRLANAR